MTATTDAIEERVTEDVTEALSDRWQTSQEIQQRASRWTCTWVRKVLRQMADDGTIETRVRGGDHSIREYRAKA